MAGFTDAKEAEILNCYLRGVNITAPTTRFLAFFSIAPADDGTGGTELSGNGYARIDVTSSFGNAATAGSIANTADVLSPVSSGAWSAVVYAMIYTASSGGSPIIGGTCSLPALSGVNEQHRIPAGSLTMTLD